MGLKIARIFLAAIITLSMVTGNVISNSSPALAIDGVCDWDYFANNNVQFYAPCGPACDIGGGSPITELPKKVNNRDKIWYYLTTRGLSPQQAAGVMGNIQVESGGTWSPTVNEFGFPFPQGGYGIVQWTHDPGRRGNLVAYMKKESASLVNNYYSAYYSNNVADKENPERKFRSYTDEKQNFFPKNSMTGELMNEDDNDGLLLDQLDFLYSESTNRMLGSAAISMGLGNAKQTEWEALQSVSTIEDASNIWLYSFENPETPAKTAGDRINYGKIIYNMYSDSETACPDSSKQQLARAIVDSGNLTYGALPQVEKDIIPNIASGKNNGDDWPCGMNLLMLQSLATLTKSHKIVVNSLNRACSNSVPKGSSLTSRHYAGNGSAIDFGSIDGKPAYGLSGAQLIVDTISPYLIANSTVGQLYDHSGKACLRTLKVPSGVRRINDFCNHLHVDVPPNGDPALRCKIVNYGGCDESQRV